MCNWSIWTNIHNLTFFFLPVQDETQAVASLPASLTHHYWDAGGLTRPSLTLPVYPELPVSRGLHDQYTGSCPPRGTPELRPRQAPEVPQATAVLKGSDEALCVGLSSSWVSPRSKDFQSFQSESEQHRGFFSQNGQRTRLQGQRPRRLAVWTDSDLKRYRQIRTWWDTLLRGALQALWWNVS